MTVICSLVSVRGGVGGQSRIHGVGNEKTPSWKKCPKIQACSYRRNNSVSFNQYNLSIDCLLFSPTKLYSIILFRQEYRPGTTESGENFGTQVAN